MTRVARSPELSCRPPTLSDLSAMNVSQGAVMSKGLACDVDVSREFQQELSQDASTEGGKVSIDRKMRPEELDAHRLKSNTTGMVSKTPASESSLMVPRDNEPELSYVVAFLLNLKAAKAGLSTNQKRNMVVKIEQKRERKRKINRLSAQRKRIRERDLIDTLSEEFKDLTSTNQTLLQEADELRGLLSTLKKQRPSCASTREQEDKRSANNATTPATTAMNALPGSREGSPPQALFHLQSLEGSQGGSAHQPALPPLDSTQWQALMALASQTAATASFPPLQTSPSTASTLPTSMDFVNPALMGLHSPPFVGNRSPDVSLRLAREAYGPSTELGGIPDSFSQSSPWMDVQRQALLQHIPGLMNHSHPSHPQVMYRGVASLSSLHNQIPSFLHQPHSVSHNLPNPLQAFLQNQSRLEPPYFQPEQQYAHNVDTIQQQLLVSLLQSAAAVQHGQSGTDTLSSPPPNSFQRHETPLPPPVEANPTTVHEEPRLPNPSPHNRQFNCLLAALTEHMPMPEAPPDNSNARDN